MTRATTESRHLGPPKLVTPMSVQLSCWSLHTYGPPLSPCIPHIQTDMSETWQNTPIWHLILPYIAVENLGAFSLSTLEFLSDLGHKLSSFSGEERASSYLFQRLSVSLQRFNSVLLHDTFVIEDVPDQ